MKKLLSIMLAVILFMININVAFPVSAAVDNSRYIPKVVGTKNGNKLIFDSEIAKIARKMSSDAYGIEKESDTTKIAKTMTQEGFKDIQIKKNTSKSSGDLPLNFIIGVKTFKVNNKEKHILAISFRGTNDATDAIADILYVDLNGFHAGFYGTACNAYLSCNDITFPSLNNMTFHDYLDHCKDGKDDNYILVTGHSLGGAIANLFTGDILAGFGVKSNAMCYTFASPTVCSSTKAKSINSYNVFNIINTKDTVPKLGYDITKGERLGIDLKATVSAGSILDNHKINGTYEKVTNQVINSIDSSYKYTTSFYTKWNNDTNKGNGKHIHNYYYNEGKCYCGEEKNTATKTDNKSTLNINLTSYPSSIKQGSSFGLRGTISSNYNIKKVSGYIMQGNTIYISSEDLPNKKNLDVKTAELNKSLNFGKLPVGNYSLYVEAVDASGQTVGVNKNFSVYEEQKKDASTLSINLERYPVSINLGSSYSVRGNVSSNYTISKVRGYIYDSNGSVVQSTTDTPNSTYMEIRPANLNQKLIFNKLSSGNYTMKVEAVDASGKIVTATKNFTVKGGGNTPSGAPIKFEIETVPKGNMPYGKDFTLKGWFRSDSAIAETRAYILDENKNVVMQSDSASSTTSNYKIEGYKLDKGIKFDQLSPGGYYLKYYVRDADGDTSTWVSDKFYIVKENSSNGIISDGVYVIATKLNKNYVLDIDGAGTSDGDNLQLWERNNTPAQTFKVTHLGNEYYRIVNTNSGKAIDAEWGGIEAGTNVWQYEVNDTPAQIWKIVSAGNGSYYIINKESGLYLDVDNAYAESGTNVKLFDRNDAYDAQKWIFIK